MMETLTTKELAALLGVFSAKKARVREGTPIVKLFFRLDRKGLLRRVPTYDKYFEWRMTEAGKIRVRRALGTA